MPPILAKDFASRWAVRFENMASRRLIVMILAAALFGACGERQARRLPRSGFAVAFDSHRVAGEMRTGEKAVADITIRNTGSVQWPSKPNAEKLYAVNLAYHWLDKKGRMVVFDGERTPLPHDLKPGESVALHATIYPPGKAGAYILEITLVQEGVAWFPERGGAKLSLPVNVTAAASRATEPAGKVRPSAALTGSVGEAPPPLGEGRPVS